MFTFKKKRKNRDLMECRHVECSHCKDSEGSAVWHLEEQFINVLIVYKTGEKHLDLWCSKQLYDYTISTDPKEFVAIRFAEDETLLNDIEDAESEYMDLMNSYAPQSEEFTMAFESLRKAMNELRFQILEDEVFAAVSRETTL